MTVVIPKCPSVKIAKLWAVGKIVSKKLNAALARCTTVEGIKSKAAEFNFIAAIAEAKDAIARKKNYSATWEADIKMAADILDPLIAEGMESEREQAIYNQRHDQIHDKIAARLGEKPVIHYSTQRNDEDGLQKDNLDEIAVEGRVCFHARSDAFFGKGVDYTSPVVESPTWLDVAVFANQAMKTTGDFAHWFFEGLGPARKKDGVQQVQLNFGS